MSRTPAACRKKNRDGAPSRSPAAQSPRRCSGRFTGLSRARGLDGFVAGLVTGLAKRATAIAAEGRLTAP